MAYQQFTLNPKDLLKHIDHSFSVEEVDEESITHSVVLRCEDCDKILHTEYEFINTDLKTMCLSWEEYEEVFESAVYEQADLRTWIRVQLHERDFPEWWELSDEEAGVAFYHNRGTTTQVIDAWLKTWPVNPAPYTYHSSKHPKPNGETVITTIKQLMLRMVGMPDEIRIGKGVDWDYLGNLFLKDWEWEWTWFNDCATAIFRERTGDSGAEWQDYEEHTIAEEYLASGHSPAEFIQKILDTHEDFQLPNANEIKEGKGCPVCGGPAISLAPHSKINHYRCRDCGVVWTDNPQKSE